MIFFFFNPILKHIIFTKFSCCLWQGDLKKEGLPINRNKKELPININKENLSINRNNKNTEDFDV
jgi:hypothetical protein